MPTVADGTALPQHRHHQDEQLPQRHPPHHLQQQQQQEQVQQHPAYPLADCSHPICTSCVVDVDGALIVGAGPSGLAAAACLRRLRIPCLLVERSDCIASLWKNYTYDRIHLHTAKHCCELPFLPFPTSYPTFLTRKHFLDYLQDYADHFGITPRFNEAVKRAVFDHPSQSWRVHTSRSAQDECGAYACVNIEYTAKWLVVATGENAEAVLPRIPGSSEFNGPIIHSSQYKNGSQYSGHQVLVVGAGNSGMEIALDLVNNGARSSIVVRSPLHVLPREMFGRSTFSVAMTLSKLIPIKLVDYILVTYSHLKYGGTSVYGLRRPKVGPLELKNKMGKTPILDVGTMGRIQRGDIKVKPAVDCFTSGGVRFVDGTIGSYDAVVFATGYQSIVPNWLEDEDHFFTEQGLSKSSINCWKGERGLYAAGLSGKGLLGATMDAQHIAKDISEAYHSSYK